MDFNAILSDQPLTKRAEVAERTDDKPSFEVDEPLGTRSPDDNEEDSAPSAEKAEATGNTEAKAEAKANEAEAEATAEAKAAADAEQSRDEKGRFQQTVPHGALHAERQKRQALEAELAKMRETKPPPSVLEDEDGAFKVRIEQATAPLQEKLLKLSVKAARNLPGREDYDDVSGVFLDAVEKDPRLLEAFRAADDPGEYAYTVGKQIKELSEVNGDIMEYGKKKRAEGAAEADALKTQIKALEAEIANLKASKEKQAKVPQSLNSEPSASGKETQQFAGPRPLKSILNS